MPRLSLPTSSLNAPLFWLIGSVVAALVHTVWLSVPRAGAWQEAAISLISIPPTLLAAAAVWSAAALHHGPERRAWRFVGAGLLAYSVGNAAWAYLSLVARRQPFPSVADAAYLCLPLAFALAFFSFPKVPLPKRDAWRLTLDALILAGAVGVWAWQRLIAPGYVDLAGQPAAQLVATAYPIFDLGLLALLGMIALRRISPWPLVIFALGMLCFAAADLSFLFLSALGSYASGNPIDGLWTWGAVACAVAAYFSLRPQGAKRAAPAALRPLRPIVLYLALLSCVALAGWAERVHDAGVLGVLCGLGALVVLIAVRQTLVWHDKERLEAQLRQLTNTLETRVQERTQQVRQTFEGGLLALGVALETRDLETSGHTERVVRLARALGRALSLPERDLEALGQGAYLHDLGKLAIPDAILLKPGKLTREEFALIKTHAARGHDIVQRLPNLAPGAADVVLHHHERWDGGGYPSGLSGSDIPLLARLFAVCDVYDALISERPYKRAWTHEAAMAEIAASAGCHFDPRVAHTFASLDVPALLRGDPSPAPSADLEASLAFMDGQTRYLQESLRYAEAVIEVSRFTTSDLAADDLCREALRVIASASPVDWGGLLVIEGDVSRVRTVWSGVGAVFPNKPEDVVARAQGVMWQAVQRAEALFTDDYAAEADAVPEFVRRGAGAIAWLPLSVEAPCTVVLSVMRRAPAPAWSAHDRQLLEAVGRSIRAALERRARLHALEKAAYRDSLTGLGNRRAYEQELEQVLARGARIGVMLLDVNGLKAVNDRFGHARGDDLLRALALALRWNVRRGDHLYRLGGDEFTLVYQAVEGQDEGPWRARVEAALASVRGDGFADASASVGFARAPEDGATVNQLTRAADERMYRAKCAGRPQEAAPPAVLGRAQE